MLEVLAYISLVYCIGAVITFCGFALWHGGVSDTFGIGLAITAALAFFWPVSIPVMIKEEWEERKKKGKKNGKNRN
ncbi:membrane protein [Cronobacter phage vB_CsaM_GAP32]|uniref:Putative membrane protein n=1 Tax=Cronobacter phage vB_CsaM_GAP32 TaxID=1141136 RepID=K4F6H7_9CAUD|nr:membrane protein [Cronobacter phage vB_CsaM_GAP32]AFC21538.1 putative membrane protein [Cronobacter phage vB_CsaM_GAP32]